jgi:hypothetical protein
MVHLLGEVRSSTMEALIELINPSAWGHKFDEETFFRDEDGLQNRCG